MESKTQEISLKSLLAERTVEGDLYRVLDDGKLECFACGHRCIIGEGVTNWGTLMAAATVIAMPPIILTFLIQRRLVSGLSFGAVKG